MSDTTLNELKAVVEYLEEQRRRAEEQVDEVVKRHEALLGDFQSMRRNYLDEVKHSRDLSKKLGDLQRTVEEVRAIVAAYDEGETQ